MVREWDSQPCGWVVGPAATTSVSRTRAPAPSGSRWLLLAIGAALAMAEPVCVRAQVAETDSVPTARRRDVVVADATSTAPDGGATATQWIPELSLGALYDSNVFATSDHPVGDMLWMATPSVRFTARGDGRSLQVDAEATEARYRDHASENSRDYRLDVNGSQRLGPRSRVFGGVGISRAHEDRTSPDDVFGTRPTVYRDGHAHAGYAFSGARWSLRTGVTLNQLRFSNVFDAQGQVIDNGDRDRNVVGVGMRASVALAPRLELFGQTTLDDRNYLRAVDNFGYRRDSRGLAWALGVASRGQGPLQGELYVGGIHQRYDDPRFSDISVPTAGARLRWQADADTVLSAALERNLEETTLVGASGYLNTTLSARADRRLAPRWSAFAAVALTRSDFRGLGRRDDIGDASVGLSYRLAPRLHLDASYRLLQRRSDEPLANYDRNEIFLGLRMGGLRLPETAVAAAVHASTEPGALRGFYAGLMGGEDTLDTTTWSYRSSHSTDRGEMAGRGMSPGVFTGFGWTLGRVWLGLEADAVWSQADWFHTKSPDSRVFDARLRRDGGIGVRAGYVLVNQGLASLGFARRRATFETAYAPLGDAVWWQQDRRMGSAWSATLETPLGGRMFARARYEAVRYDAIDIVYDTGSDRFSHDLGRFQMGVGVRFGPSSTSPSVAVERDGIYVGAQGGDDRSGSLMDAVHRQSGPPALTAFSAEFGDRGNVLGAFAGYGRAFGHAYAGIELESDASHAAWEHDKEPGGRDFGVSTRGSYGAAIRLGYATAAGGLVYVRGGRVRGRFQTTYIKGGNASSWVDRTDTRTGTRFGVGLEAPLSPRVFMRMDYTVTRYAAIDFTTTQAAYDEVRFRPHQQMFRLGLGLRFGAGSGSK